jgi:hypothetical protein
MLLAVVKVLLSQHLVTIHQQIHSIFLFGSSAEIERAGDNNLPVDDHNLVVGDGVRGVNVALWNRRSSPV